MATVSEVFTQAWNLHHAGAFAQAEQLYRQIVQADPSHADAWCYLGVACQAQVKLDEAEANFRRAIQLAPAHPSAGSFLGAVLLQQGKLVEAVASFKDALRIEPDNKEIQSNLGLALVELGNAQSANGKLEESVISYQRAVRLRANDAVVHYKLAGVLVNLQELEEAGDHLRQAIRIQPNFPEAHNNLGLVLQRQGKLAEAVVHWREALRWRPDSPEVHNNLGNALQSQADFEHAIKHYRRALHLQPDSAAAHNNLGNVLCIQGHLEDAVANWLEALRCRPDFAEPHYNLGKELHKRGRIDDALHHYNEALRLNPDYADAHWNRSLAWLLQGNFKIGWPEYEWRWTQPEFVVRPFKQPCWDGSNFNHRSILLYVEQGLGDTIQMIRYAPLVKQRGGTVILEHQPCLSHLLAGVPGIDRLVAQGSPLPAFDVQTPLLSLPGIFGSSLATIPAAMPYMQGDPRLVAHWRQELAKIRRSEFLVGIAWQGSPNFRGDPQRSIPLKFFGPLAAVPNVRLISLQKGPGTDQVAALAGRFDVHDLGNRLDGAAGAFMDTAAMMKNLDLVISSDTAVPHLAGALGVPVWVALAMVPDWRWLLKREDSPWYPTMRLFRQTRLGLWDNVFERMAKELERAAEEKRLKNG